jgi:hypothetical protein
MMNTMKNDSKAQGVLLTLAVLLSGAATLWVYVQWDVLTDIDLPWRNALLPLPMLVWMGMTHWLSRPKKAADHE